MPGHVAGGAVRNAVTQAPPGRVSPSNSLVNTSPLG